MPTTASSPTWLDDLRIVDTRDGSSRVAAIAIAAGTIADVAAAAPDGSGARSFGGAYVLPGLVSCHTHLQASYPYGQRDQHEDPATTFARAAAQARVTVMAGVTTVRCLHELHAVDIQVRATIVAGQASGPRILAAGRALTVPGGHGDGLGCRVVSGESGFHDAALAELDGGADHVKVFASGGLARAGERMDEPEMTLGEMRGAVRAASSRGTYVTAHAASSKTILQGLAAGIRSFEHAYRLDATTAREMAREDAWLTPTLVVTHSPQWQRANGFEPAAIERGAAAADAHMASIRHALEAGVHLVNGTDFPPGSLDDGVPLVVRELELLVRAGATPLAAIQSATIDAARLLRREELGRIEVGGPADLMAVAGDPVADVATMERISLVIAGGVVVRDSPPMPEGAERR